jgi:hypothetical protein
VARFDIEGDLAQQLQCSRQLAIGEVVAHLSTLTGCPHQTAATQAGEMVGDIGPALTHFVRELGRVCRSVDEPNKNLSSHSVGHGGADPSERVEPSIEAKIDCHEAHYSSVETVIQS